MKFKIINGRDKNTFESNLEYFCECNIVTDIKYSISSDSADNIIYSAMILYK